MTLDDAGKRGRSRLSAPPCAIIAVTAPDPCTSRGSRVFGLSSRLLFPFEIALTTSLMKFGISRGDRELTGTAHTASFGRGRLRTHMSKSKRDLRLAFKRLEQEMPNWMGRVMRWLRHPASRLIRVPAGLLLILGGLLAFLPVLGIWMLPLGLLLIAYDVPMLRKPMSRFTHWSAERWAGLRRWAARRRGGSA